MVLNIVGALVCVVLVIVLLVGLFRFRSLRKRVVSECGWVEASRTWLFLEITCITCIAILCLLFTEIVGRTVIL